MPSSSVFAVPLDIDLTPGVWELSALTLAATGAIFSIVLADLVLPVRLILWLLVAVLAAHCLRQLRARPKRLRLYAEGAVESSGQGDLQPAELQQSTRYLGLIQLAFRDSSARHHRVVLFPDRIDTRDRHRLRVWLATHRPESGTQKNMNLPTKPSQGLRSSSP